MTEDHHVCSARTQETCPACGFTDTRDAFECWVTTTGGTGPTRFTAICPRCEAEYPDTSDHDDLGCEACYEAEMDELAERRRATALPPTGGRDA